MAARSSGLPGLAVALAAAGGWLVYTGVRGVAPLDGLRTLLRGSLPKPAPSSPSGGNSPGGGSPTGGYVPGGGSLGQRIATEAQKYAGVPYKWGGNTPAGWDCSGFANYVLRKVGVPLGGRPTTATYITWGGASNVPRSETSAGDLVMYPGHMGIALDGERMIHAPTAGKPTTVARIYGTPIAIRRVRT